MLTDEQLLAVESEEPKVIVRAGAGSGKTTLITERALELQSRGLGHICIMTFSRAAARELRERLPDKAFQIGTFHSVILDELAKRGERYNVLSDEESSATIREAAMGAGSLSMVKGKPVWTKSEGYWRKVADNRDECNFTKIYESILARRGDIDYAGILRKGWELSSSGKWAPQAVIVDEAQDNDLLQWQITNHLSKNAEFTFVVGDVNQTVHEWRGARPDLFEALCSQWATYSITKTFRCPSRIVEEVNKIRHINLRLVANREGGTLLDGSGDIVSRVNTALTVYEPGDIAILCRYNHHVEDAITKLTMMGMPYRGATQQEEVGPIYWLLRCLANPASATAREKAADAILPYMAFLPHPLFSYLISNNHLSWTYYVKQFFEEVGVSFGPAELLAKLQIPPALSVEARKYATEYANRTMHDFYVDQGHLTDSPSMAIFVGTIHGAKGLEWPCVIVDGIDGKRVEETECRLLYVAMTRAKGGLALPLRTGNGCSMKYKISSELSELHRKLNQLEYEQLEKNIKSAGKVIHPIVVWGEYILDGQNRYEIANRLNLPFEVREMNFTSLDQAKLWVINDQLGKRNNSEQEMTRLRVEKAKLEGTKEAAKATGVTQRTVQRDMIADKGRDLMPDDIKERIDTGKIVATKANISEYAKLSDKDRKEVDDKLRKHPTLTLHQALPKDDVMLSPADLELVNKNQALNSFQKRALASGAKKATSDGLRKFLALKTEDQEIVAVILDDNEIDSLDDAVRTFKAGKNPTKSDITEKENKVRASLNKKLEECLRLADDLKEVKKDKSGHNGLIEAIKDVIRKLGLWK